MKNAVVCPVSEKDSPEKKSGRILGKLKKGRRIGLIMLIMSLVLAIPAFAEGETGISAVTGALTTVTSLVSEVFTLITGNAVLATFMAIGLLGAAIGLFRRLKRASR